MFWSGMFPKMYYGTNLLDIILNEYKYPMQVEVKFKN